MPKKTDETDQGALMEEAHSITNEKEEPPMVDNYHLTPSEIESLRTHGKQISAQLRGRRKARYQD